LSLIFFSADDVTLHHVSTINCDSTCYMLVTALQQRVTDAHTD